MFHRTAQRRWVSKEALFFEDRPRLTWQYSGDPLPTRIQGEGARVWRCIHTGMGKGAAYYLRKHQRHRREVEPALLLRPFHQPELTEKLHLVEVEPVAGDDPIFDCRDIAGTYPHGFAGRRNGFPRGAL